MEVAAQVVHDYRVAAMMPLLESARALLQTADLSIAVVGRFKAGKSSFLNDLFGFQLLPIGVLPVTSVITEVTFGPAEDVLIEFLDGHSDHRSTADISQFVSEATNPRNAKGVARMVVRLPSLERFRSLRFVDTPGLESVFSHNTEASLNWLPRIGLALVAIGVDPPLTQQDINLIRKVYEYTPHVAILLTKIDTVSDAERIEIEEFIWTQLRSLGLHLHIFPYSNRTGFGHYKGEIERQLLRAAVDNFDAQREALLCRKIDTILRECEQFLGLALRAAEIAEAERADLKQRIIGEREAIEDVKRGIRIAAEHAAAGTRRYVEQTLSAHEIELKSRLLDGLAERFPKWNRGISYASLQFQLWLTASITEEMKALSRLNGAKFAARVRKLSSDFTRLLQGFRNGFSGRTRQTLGVPLETVEIEMTIESPRAPDVTNFKIFDHNWEVFSWLIPMPIFNRIVRNHFERKIRLAVEANLSRLTSQWEDTVNKSLFAIAAQAENRVDRMVQTIEDLLSHAYDERPAIQAALSRVDQAREEVRPDITLE